MATGSTAAVRKEALAKQKATCAQRLIPRLARYFGEESNAGKQKVRAVLVAGGYPGPGWDDEARAVAILTAAGRDMSKFERTGTVENGPTEVPVQKRYSISKLYSTSAEAAQPKDGAAEKLKNVTIILMQAEKEIVRQFKDGRLRSLGGLAVTVGAALDEIRR